MKTIKDLSSLRGKTALVSGGCGHIGLVICETLAELGASVIILDLVETKGDKIAAKLKSRFRINSKFQACDLSADGDIKKVAAAIKNFSGKLDILVNNAALVGTVELEGWAVALEKQSIKTWRQALDVNLTGAFHLIKVCLPLMKQKKGSSIINIGSIYGISGMDMNLYKGENYLTPAAYAASKGGLTQLSKYLATALAPDIRVNTISLGGIERGQNAEFQRRYNTVTPLGRMGREEDIKGAIAFLSSNLSSYVTGQNIVVDGGWSV